MSRTLAIGVRYNQLRGERIPAKEAAEIVRREFNVKLKDVTIKGYASTARKRAEPRERSEPSAEVDQSGRSDRNARKDGKDGNAHSEGVKTSDEEDLDDRIRRIARGIFQEMIAAMQPEGSVIADLDFPPESQTIRGERKGRKENREYEKVSITIDQVLWSRFVAECKRLRVSRSRMMDTILWRAFGRPPLSYMTEDAKE